MEFIRIPNAIVTTIINASDRTNYVKQNVPAIKNSALTQVDVVQRVMHQCHVVHIFQEVTHLKVCLFPNQEWFKLIDLFDLLDHWNTGMLIYMVLLTIVFSLF